jgi:hypothetical protein
MSSITIDDSQSTATATTASSPLVIVKSGTSSPISARSDEYSLPDQANSDQSGNIIVELRIIVNHPEIKHFGTYPKLDFTSFYRYLFTGR